MKYLILILALISSHAWSYLFGYNIGETEHFIRQYDKAIKIESTPSSTPDPREYQLRLELDSTYLYDGKRLIGKWANNPDKGGIDSLILLDNL